MNRSPLGFVVGFVDVGRDGSLFPHEPDIKSMLMLIPWRMDRDRGLEDQLLASVVGAEEPDLERTKNELVQVILVPGQE